MNKTDFNKYVFIIENKQGFPVVYNSYSGEILKFADKFENLKLDDDEKRYLAENYFLQEKDGKSVSEIVNETRINLSQTKISASFTIHLTYSCNFKCPYCYQNDIKSSVTMDKNIEEKLYTFFEKVKAANELEVVDFTFIGGEPLLCTDLMLRIRENADKIFSHIKRRYSIVSNGYLLNSDMILKLKPYKWEFVQITLDGTKSIHDSLRIKKDGSGSFSTIIDNIKHCEQNELPVVINYNLSKNNSDSLEEFLQILKSENIKSFVEFSQIFECEGNFKTNKIYANHKKGIWYEAHKTAQKYGYSYSPFYRQPYLICGRQRLNNFNISPDGKLYKCISGVGQEEYLVGSLEEYGTSEYYKSENSFINDSLLTDKCKSCKFEIICGGGCKFKQSVYGKSCPYNDLAENDFRLLEEDLTNE